SAGSALWAEGPGFRIDLADPGAGSRVRGDLPRRVVLGIRPEALRIEPAAPGEDECAGASAGETGGSNAVRGRVDLVEVLGADAHIHVILAGGTRLTVRAPGDAGLHPGDVVVVRVDLRRVHLFDPESGRAI
ncbi:MAG: TOBE domain-containing protein, partial [Clostridia bacterium]|nr:TOBE domain-containing protein [Clostridia bacterium]